MFPTNNADLIFNREEDLEMVEFRDLLPRCLVWQLDPRKYNGRDRPELVAEYSCYLCQSDDFLNRNVLQLKVRECLPHRISRGSTQRLWHVGKLLFCCCESLSSHHLVRSPA